MEPYWFRAFVSYSRSDRKWAKTLQARLERYVLPHALRLVKPGVRHDRRPLKPIFRDEDELVPGQDLPERIRQGLEQAEYLLVVCSPRAAASDWVGKEINDFIALGREDYILAVVVDGEPNAETRGLAPHLECLPRELRFQPEFRKDEAGKTTISISSRPAEPLWVDWRKSNHRNRPMFLRVVAALLCLSSLDELVRKDQAYRRRRAALLWSMTGVTACCIVGLWGDLLVQAHKTAVKESETLVALAQKATQDQQWERSARYALLAMKRADRPVIGFQARTSEDALVGSLLNNQRAGPAYSFASARQSNANLTELQEFKSSMDELAEGFKSEEGTLISRDGRVLAVAAEDGTLRVLDAATGKPLRATLQVGRWDSVSISPDGKLLAVFGRSANGDEDLSPHSLDIWDLTSGTKIRTLAPGADAGGATDVESLDFSPGQPVPSAARG